MTQTVSTSGDPGLKTTGWDPTEGDPSEPSNPVLEQRFLTAWRDRGKPSSVSVWFGPTRLETGLAFTPKLTDYAQPVNL